MAQIKHEGLSTTLPLGDSKMSKRISIEALWIVWWLRMQELRGRL